MAVKQGERSVRTENCLSARSKRVFSVQQSEPLFYPYFSTVLTFSLVLSICVKTKERMYISVAF
jgi:hypothetical protein